MCHAAGSSPPGPPGSAGAIARRGDLTLTAADGNRLLAYRSVPASVGPAGGGVGVVLLPDVRGLHGFYRRLADRFAEVGIAALAIDYYGRTADDHVRDGGFDGFAHAGRLRPEHTAADVRAAVDRLLADGVTSVFTVGFCLGGAASWNQSAVDERVAGAVGFYGRPDEARSHIREMRAPLLVLAAGADMLTSEEDSRSFDRELTEAGVPHRFVLYEGAPHSFFDGGFAEHREASADAWRQVLRFVKENR